MDDFLQMLPDFFHTAVGVLVLLVISLWSVVWKMLALYRAGSYRHKGWFVALFFINTVGILEILYLTIFSRKGKIS
jgi:methionyl-tRNA synthetase